MEFTTNFDHNYAKALDIAKAYMAIVDNSTIARERKTQVLKDYRENSYKAEDDRDAYVEYLEAIDAPINEHFSHLCDKYGAAKGYADNLENLFYELEKVHDILTDLAYCAMEYAENDEKIKAGH